MRDLIEAVEADVINELRGYTSNKDFEQVQSLANNKRLNPDSFKELLRAHLKELGFNLVGRGANGLVFQSPSHDYVIKVFREDEAYLNWVRYCLTNASSPYLPNFRGKFVKLGRTDSYAVRMEKLAPLTDANEDLFELIYDYCKCKSQVIDNPRLIERAQATEQAYPGLLDVLDNVRNLGAMHYVDIHEGNVMMRGDTPVIIDPIAA